MNRYLLQRPPRWWSPKLSPFWMRLWRPIRRRFQLRGQRLLEVEVHGMEHVRDAVASGRGVLITPNHSAHADCFAMYAASDLVGYPFYFMVAWQVLGQGNWLRCMALRHHGCFSVDREGTDMQAFRQAVEILQSAPYPLVIFPEGEVYHCNDRLRPFREGPAAMALLAARKGSRPVVCVPCAVKYRYLQDPTPELLELMGRLEQAIYWRPRPDLSLQERIYRLAEGLLALKEIELLGHTCSGSPSQRIAELVEFLLGVLEKRHHIDGAGMTIPERVKALRRGIFDRLQQLPENDPERQSCERSLEDVFLAVQLYSYPGDYVSEQPTIERIAETLDKLEEDVLEIPSATIRGTRRAEVTFDEPILVEKGRSQKGASHRLTLQLEERGQQLLDESGGRRRVSDTEPMAG
jgi:1-acyl-sn-glycerol-3-phosphate acyltransferase